jgi:hypothetical protein
MITTLLLSLLLTVAHPPEHQAVMTTYVLAERAGVSPNMAVCILLRESGGHTWAVGDGGRGVGAWALALYHRIREASMYAAERRFETVVERLFTGKQSGSA